MLFLAHFKGMSVCSRIVTDSGIKGLAGCARGLLLDPSFKEVPTSSESWKQAGLTKYISLSEFFSSLGTNIVGGASEKVG